MHHTAGREFRNEHNSCHYLLHTGTTELPPGDTNASIAAPRPGRFEWPSIGSLLAYAVPPAPAAACPRWSSCRATSLMRYPGRGAGLLGPRYERWGVDLAPPCRSPDPAGSCPNCFSHDDPNDPARAAGQGAEGVVGQQQLPRPRPSACRTSAARSPSRCRRSSSANLAP